MNIYILETIQKVLYECALKGTTISSTDLIKNHLESYHDNHHDNLCKTEARNLYKNMEWALSDVYEHYCISDILDFLTKKYKINNEPILTALICKDGTTVPSYGFWRSYFNIGPEEECGYDEDDYKLVAGRLRADIRQRITLFGTGNSGWYKTLLLKHHAIFRSEKADLIREYRNVLKDINISADFHHTAFNAKAPDTRQLSLLNDWIEAMVTFTVHYPKQEVTPVNDNGPTFSVESWFPQHFNGQEPCYGEEYEVSAYSPIIRNTDELLTRQITTVVSGNGHLQLESLFAKFGKGACLKSIEPIAVMNKDNIHLPIKKNFCTDISHIQTYGIYVEPDEILDPTSDKSSYYGNIGFSLLGDQRVIRYTINDGFSCIITVSCILPQPEM